MPSFLFFPDMLGNLAPIQTSELFCNGNAVHLLAQGRVGNIPSKLPVETTHALRTFLIILSATKSKRQNQGAITAVKLLPEFQSNVLVDPFIAPPAVFAYSSHILYTADKCFKIIAVEKNEC